MLFQLSCSYAKLNPREVGLCHSFTASITKSQPANKVIYLEKFIKHTNELAKFEDQRIGYLEPSLRSLRQQAVKNRAPDIANPLAQILPT